MRPLSRRHLSSAGDDELVDDDLRAVGEVTELRLPQHQRRRGSRASSRTRSPGTRSRRAGCCRPRTARRPARGPGAGRRCAPVFTSCSTAFRWPKVPRSVSCPVSRTCVPVREQGGVGEVLAGGPVERNLAAGHRRAPLEDLSHLAQRGEALAARAPGARAAAPASSPARRSPARGCPPRARRGTPSTAPRRRWARAAPASPWPGCRPGGSAAWPPRGCASASSALTRPCAASVFGVELGHRRVVPDRLVHQRLGVARLVALVVAVAAEADQVDDHVALEPLPVLGGQPHRVDAGLRVVAVHVEDGDVEHLRHGGAVDARARRPRGRWCSRAGC